MLTAECLRELLHYDPETGVFTRLKSAGPARIGDVAGSTQRLGYRAIKINGRLYGAHRLAVLYVTGEWPAGDVDHENVTPGDDRWENLRVANASLNAANRKLSRANTSGYKGVSWSKRSRKWHAAIKVRGKDKHLGYFDTPEAAHAAYFAGAQEHFGEFARSGS